ncbi:MAG: hypothetical protein ACRDZX_00695, partial [Acidimicrobiales bacterium]
HTPALVGDSPYGHRGRAFALGYIQGLTDMMSFDRLDGPGPLPQYRSMLRSAVREERVPPGCSPGDRWRTVHVRSKA